MTILRSQKGPKRGPKWSPKRFEFEAKIEDEKRSSLGPSLGRYGIALVPILRSKFIEIHWILYGFVKNHNF